MPPHVSFFVPGRVCLVGEHSDWAGGLRTSIPSLSPGLALVAGTREGLRVSASRRDDCALALSSAVGGELLLAPSALLATARDPGLWRYAAGVAYVIGDRWGVRGLRLALESDLPVAKGLSSSAAVCIAVARAFNRLYSLGLSVAGEMELAYAGERLTGSMCGRMDQCVAFGAGMVALMEFDGEVTAHRLIKEPVKDVFIVFADLAAAKDTTLILRDMQAAVGRNTTAEDKNLIEALGSRNKDIVMRAASALEAGDSELLGRLFYESQALFDATAMPICPEQLTAPRLHEAMHHPKLTPYIYGAKGVGSQGDGAVQFVARGETEAGELIQALQNLGMPGAYMLRLGNGSGKQKAQPDDTSNGRKGLDAKALPVKRKVTTAVIAAAGFGTRLFPASRSIRPKSLIPIIDSDGFVKPLLLHIAELCVKEAIEKIIIVTGPGEQVDRVREVFSPVEPSLAEALSKKKHIALYAESIVSLSDKVQIVVQETPEGFGDAVAKGAPFLGENEPFVLLLGDVVFKTSGHGPNCLRQCLDIFERDPGARSVIGVSEVPVTEAGTYGVVDGVRDELISALKVFNFVEKPDKEKAAALAKDNMCKIVLGPYVFHRQVMDALVEDVRTDSRLGGEVQLTPAVARVMNDHGLLAVALEGKSLDTGNPKEYASTMMELADYALPAKQ